MADMVKKLVQEEEEEPLRPQESKMLSGAKPVSKTITNRPAKAFAFWAYFTLFVSLVTLLFSSVPSLRPADQRSWFLSLPDDLRHHYSKGKLIKVQHPAPNRPSIQVFVVEDGPREAETVVLVHGLGSTSYSFRRVLHSLSSGGLRAVAVDLPGSGFSDKLEDSVEGSGIFQGWIWCVYSDIREKGLFWGFDQLIENGQIPYHDEDRRNGIESLGYGSPEMGRILGQVIDSMALAPVHLVLHDSALGAGTNWVSLNTGSVSSVTIVDSATEFPAFPSLILGTPILGHLLQGSSFMFARLLRLCCSRSLDGSAAEAYRLLLKGRDERTAVVAAGKAWNSSFDLAEWAGSDVVKGLPVQVLWSNSWSDVWIEQGRRVAAAMPQAKFAFHSGGRWPQEDAAEEIAGMIAQFVSTLPKSIRPIEQESLQPVRNQKMFDEASDGHHHDHHGHGHGHEHTAGFVGMYGLNQGLEADDFT